MDKGKYIVTINREYGSGGRIIGQMLAEKLNIPYYDKEIISLTAKKSGFTEDFVKEVSEKKTMSLLYSLYMTSLPVSDQIFFAQSQVIKDISDKNESCVIVGGCAEYVLRDLDCCFKVFIHSPFEERVRRVREDYKEVTEDFKNYVIKQDKKRVTYYNYFTQNKWGHAKDYDLAIDSALGLEVCADVIAAAAGAFNVIHS